MEAKFIDAVNNHNLTKVRIALANEILLNANGNSFHEMLNYAEHNLSDLYDEHDGEVFDEDYSNFTSDNVAAIRNKLDFNFSKERLAYYENVVKCVQGEKRIPNAEPEKKTAVEYKERNLLSTSMLIAGGIIIMGGIVASKTIPIVIGVTLATAGAVTFVKNNIKR